MNAYLLTSATIFGLLAAAHLLRIAAEGPQVAWNPWFVLTTVVAAAMCLWAVRLLRSSAPSR